MEQHQIPVVGVPKTIDNDLSATDFTFGFFSAVDVATEALDRLHTTAEAHDRVMLLEVMGRNAGWIALYAGLAGGADCIIIPEIPYDIGRICKKIEDRKNLGRQFTLVVVAEGAAPLVGAEAAVPVDGSESVERRKAHDRAAETIALAIADRLPVETRVTVLGHLQRGGSPVAFDRILATRMGVAAVELIEAERWGEMVCLRDGEITGAPLHEAVATYRRVDPDGGVIRAARATGIEFGG
jgi:6-phosphofructokinase 1